MSGLNWDKASKKQRLGREAVSEKGARAHEMATYRKAFDEAAEHWLPRMMEAITARREGRELHLDKPEDLENRMWKGLWARAYQALDPEQAKRREAMAKTRKAQRRASARADVRGKRNRQFLGIPLRDPRLEEWAQKCAASKRETPGVFIPIPDDVTIGEWKSVWARAYYLLDHPHVVPDRNRYENAPLRGESAS